MGVDQFVNNSGPTIGQLMQSGLRVRYSSKRLCEAGT